MALVVVMCLPQCALADDPQAPSAATSPSLSDQSTEILLGTFAYLTGLFGGPALHYLNGRPNGISRLSLQVAGAGGGLGILIGTAAAAGQRSQPYAQDIAMGCEIGLAAGMVVDALVLGWSRTTDRKLAGWMPTMRLERGGGATAGIAGSFSVPPSGAAAPPACPGGGKDLDARLTHRRAARLMLRGGWRWHRGLGVASIGHVSQTARQAPAQDPESKPRR